MALRSDVVEVRSRRRVCGLQSATELNAAIIPTVRPNGGVWTGALGFGVKWVLETCLVVTNNATSRRPTAPRSTWAACCFGQALVGYLRCVDRLLVFEGTCRVSLKKK